VGTPAVSDPARAPLAGGTGRPAVVATAVTVTLLGCDAWFDLTTASTMSDAVTSAVTAVAGELPLAALLGVLVLRAHRTATAR
jgi:hypothetical protein